MYMEYGIYTYKEIFPSDVAVDQCMCMTCFITEADEPGALEQRQHFFPYYTNTYNTLPTYIHTNLFIQNTTNPIIKQETTSIGNGKTSIVN